MKQKLNTSFLQMKHSTSISTRLLKSTCNILIKKSVIACNDLNKNITTYIKIYENVDETDKTTHRSRCRRSVRNTCRSPCPCNN